MSVTRLIPANTPSQVNAEKIGVQIQLGPGPQIVDYAVIDYTYDEVSPSETVQLVDNQWVATYGEGYLCFFSSGNELERITGETFVVDGVTYWFTEPFGDDGTYAVASTNPQDGDTLYSYSDDGEGNYTVDDSGYTVVRFNMTNPYMVYNMDISNNVPIELEDSNGLLSYYISSIYGIDAIYDGNGAMQCFYAGYQQVILPECYFYPVNYDTTYNVQNVFINIDGTDYWGWETSGLPYPVVCSGGQYGLTLNPAESLGLTPQGNYGPFFFNTINTQTYNVMTIKNLVTHTGEPTDSPYCQVEYSVDGQTWTAYPDYLTDYNNVICNIPRYMYLRFSQDVLITEE